MDNFKSVVVLAGGKSSRMGFDKQMMVINDKRLIYNLCKSLENEFDDIIIVSNKPNLYKDCSYKVISDDIKNIGPLGGIYVGLKESKSRYLYVVACDMPNVDITYIKNLKECIKKDIELKKEGKVYICKNKGELEFFHGFYAKNLYTELYDFLYMEENKKSIKNFIKDKDTKVVDSNLLFDNNNKNIFINLNTMKDLNTHLNYIKKCTLKNE